MNKAGDRGSRTELSVGEAAKRSGVAVSTLHFYEVQGADQSIADPRQSAALSARSAEAHRDHRGGAKGRHPSRDHPASPCVASRTSLTDARGLAQAVEPDGERS